MMEDLERRENLARAYSREKEEEERTIRRFQDEVARIRATKSQRAVPAQTENVEKLAGEDEKGKILKVSWKPLKSGGADYTAAMLKDHFSQYGKVEDIVIRHKKGALVVMSSREQVVHASRQPHGSLHVEPVVPIPGFRCVNTFAAASKGSQDNAPSDVGILVGNAFHVREDSVLEKMRKKAEQLKSQGT
ncbi:hypothetical protein KP509_02G005400 [Ceratopteris richardii]|nr:hypothetical protein KP509_02G005400 [Ceratopteris richardii]